MNVDRHRSLELIIIGSKLAEENENFSRFFSKMEQRNDFPSPAVFIDPSREKFWHLNSGHPVCFVARTPTRCIWSANKFPFIKFTCSNSNSLVFTLNRLQVAPRQSGNVPLHWPFGEACVPQTGMEIVKEIRRSSWRLFWIFSRLIAQPPYAFFLAAKARKNSKYTEPIQRLCLWLIERSRDGKRAAQRNTRYACVTVPARSETYTRMKIRTYLSNRR